MHHLDIYVFVLNKTEIKNNIHLSKSFTVTKKEGDASQSDIDSIREKSVYEKAILYILWPYKYFFQYTGANIYFNT